MFFLSWVSGNVSHSVRHLPGRWQQLATYHSLSADGIFAQEGTSSRLPPLLRCSANRERHPAELDSAWNVRLHTGSVSQENPQICRVVLHPGTRDLWSISRASLCKNTSHADFQLWKKCGEQPLQIRQMKGIRRVDQFPIAVMDSIFPELGRCFARKGERFTENAQIAEASSEFMQLLAETVWQSHNSQGSS
eukprot:s1903_g5.t1